jgi:hypothetical protein
MVIPPKDFEDKTRESVRYSKDVKRHIVNVDSRFRAVPKSTVTVRTYDGVTETTIIRPSNSAAFAVLLPAPIKNAITLKITAISIPNDFYTFSSARQNTSFKLYHYETANNPPVTITVPDGNYSSTQDLVDTIQERLSLVSDLEDQTVFPYHITYDSLSNKVTFYKEHGDNTSGQYPFGLDFTPATIDTPFDNGIGYYLGFQELKYGNAPGSVDDVIVPLTSRSSLQILSFKLVSTTITAYMPSTYGIQVGTVVTITKTFDKNYPTDTFNIGTFTVTGVVENTSITYTNSVNGRSESRSATATFTADRESAIAESFPEVKGDHYIFLGINDYVNIEHDSFKETFFPAFAKILLPDNSKGKFISDITLQNVVQKQYYFLQPVNLNRLDITLYDPYGNYIDIKGGNFSMTLEIDEVLNQGLYDKLREL